MDRLTIRNSDGAWDVPLRGDDDGAYIPSQEIIDRLAAYEDTGLEPEEVRGIKTAYDEVQIPYEVVATGADAARVIRLLDADDEGRLLVLPCKVGDTIYEIDLPEYGVIVCKVIWIDYYIGPAAHIQGNEMVAAVSVSVEVIDGHGKGSCYAFEQSDFGKTVFLTREDAEKALEGMKNEL